MNNWQSIDSAPRDGTEVLVFGEHWLMEGLGTQGGEIHAIAIYDPVDAGMAFDWRIAGDHQYPVWVRATQWQPKPEDMA